jgi:hypothetical protein
MTITVMYSCAGCGLEKAAVDVPAREQEDVTVWMARTMLRVSAHHVRVSPSCPAETLSDLMIPIAGADRVGGPSIQ